jgi:hypothetical protein
MRGFPDRMPIAQDWLGTPGDGIEGRGEYLLLNCGGDGIDQCQYLLVRDTDRNEWWVNAMCLNKHGQVVLIPFGIKFMHLHEAKEACYEHAGEAVDDRRLRAHEEALDAEEREEPQYLDYEQDLR